VRPCGRAWGVAGVGVVYQKQVADIDYYTKEHKIKIQLI
jgi:hypothetical protein